MSNETYELYDINNNIKNIIIIINKMEKCTLIRHDEKLIEKHAYR